MDYLLISHSFTQTVPKQTDEAARDLVRFPFRLEVEYESA